MAKLFDTIGPRFKARPGGYTRILHMAPRPGDNAEMALMQLVERSAPVAVEAAPEDKKAKKAEKAAERPTKEEKKAKSEAKKGREKAAKEAKAAKAAAKKAAKKSPAAARPRRKRPLRRRRRKSRSSSTLHTKDGRLRGARFHLAGASFSGYSQVSQYFSQYRLSWLMSRQMPVWFTNTFTSERAFSS